MGASSTHKGWRRVAGALTAVYNNTEVFRLTASAFTSAKALAVTGGITATTGNVTLSGTAAEFIAATGNVRIGNPGAFATTQPQGAVIMGGSSLSGIAPAGAITTGGAVFASDTVVRKIIAAGTASNVES